MHISHFLIIATCLIVIASPNRSARSRDVHGKCHVDSFGLEGDSNSYELEAPANDVPSDYSLDFLDYLHLRESNPPQYLALIQHLCEAQIKLALHRQGVSGSEEERLSGLLVFVNLLLD